MTWAQGRVPLKALPRAVPELVGVQPRDAGPTAEGLEPGRDVWHGEIPANAADRGDEQGAPVRVLPLDVLLKAGAKSGTEPDVAPHRPLLQEVGL